MNNKLILFCLLICPLSFASKPLPAAGAGAGRDLPTVAAAQAAVAQQSAAQVDIKQLQEQQKNDSATIARLAAELEALKLQMDKDKEKSKKKWLCSRNCKLNGNNEWTEELVMKAKDSDKFLILTSIYYFEKENLSVNNAFYNRMFNVKTTGINCAKSVTGDEKLSLVVNAMNFRVLCLFNGLLDCRAIDDLDGIITGNGACEMTL